MWKLPFPILAEVKVPVKTVCVAPQYHIVSPYILRSNNIIFTTNIIKLQQQIATVIQQYSITCTEISIGKNACDSWRGDSCNSPKTLAACATSYQVAASVSTPCHLAPSALPTPRDDLSRVHHQTATTPPTSSLIAHPHPCNYRTSLWRMQLR